MYGTNNYSRPVEPLDTSMDEEYDYAAAALPTPTPTSASAEGLAQNHSYNAVTTNGNFRTFGSDKIIDPDDAEEALQDLAELEELQKEAERMKAVGNKHMAAQEYVQAYNAYSAALQLSPVGPSSHVFLSNRAATLLSLKRYAAAATDARRAIALAPTFGKAHARLGQALYFLKEYQGAIEAYQDSIHYEPDNPITLTYLEKAEAKLEKQKSRNSDGVSVMTEATGLTTAVGQMSVATDPNNEAGIMQNRHYTGANSNSRAAILHATAKQQPAATQQNGSSFKSAELVDDPEFEEALRIQQRANAFLVNKQYRQAIEEYTAALFLVPDDVNLSPDLHLGRAHALNGSRRHESAKNDAVLALRLQESAAAYSTLAKSLFYMKDYQGAIEAFANCKKQLPDGETLGMFDQAYLEKAEKALVEESASLTEAGKIHGGNTTPSKKTVPKIPPPRFVPREEAVHSPASMRSMPKEWPQQSPTSRESLRCGPERDVVCLSEGLGIKLNRGSDGIVRVLSVTDPASSPELIRQGEIFVGDVIREAAGVDIRRPITNIMWGDTVALIKMAPRPITLTVAEEMSPVPLQVLEEQRKATGLEPPSKASDENPTIAATATIIDDEDIVEIEDPQESEPDVVEVKQNKVIETHSMTEKESIVMSKKVDDVILEIYDIQETRKDTPDVGAIPKGTSETLDTVLEQTDDEDYKTPLSSALNSETDDDNQDDDIESVEDQEGGQELQSSQSPVPVASSIKTQVDDPSYETVKSLRFEEEKIVGGEILFLRDIPPSYAGWDQLRWMAHNGIRKVNFCQSVYRLSTTTTKRKGLPLFWKQGGKQYEERALIVYDEPSLILIVRRPTSIGEIQQLLGLLDEQSNDDTWALNLETALTSYWVLESVADPATSKLRLSPLTTATSVANETADDREKSCFQILTPTESIVLSALHVRLDAKKREQSYKDSGAFLETLSIETSISQAIIDAHNHKDDIGSKDRDIAWKHQVVIGSLHSLVLSGNPKFLEEGIQQARESTNSRGDAGVTLAPNALPASIVDAVDDNGFPPLYYACTHKMASAVQLLVNAGANVNYKTEVTELSVLHISARNLDDKSLVSLLSASFPSRPDPNILDKKGRTPMYVALVEGSAIDNKEDPVALQRCLLALEARGGTMLTANSPPSLRNPISALAYMNLPNYMAVALDHVPYHFPLPRAVNFIPGGDSTMSLSALYQYPMHSALLTIRKQIRKSYEKGNVSYEVKLLQTLETLLEYGFEPNERVDRCAFAGMTAFDEFVGFSPLQILALIALELDALKEEVTVQFFDKLFTSIANLAECLVGNGARLSLDPPIQERLRRKDVAALDVATSSPKSVVILSQKLESDRHVLSLLGGDERLNLARKKWTETKKVATTNINDLIEDDKTNIDDSSSAGGSDSLSCAICWTVFGALINRKHKCRVMRKYVCDDCSSKRLIQVTTEYRLSDGQFNLARAEAVKEQKKWKDTEQTNEGTKAKCSEKARAATRLERLEAEEQSKRDSLFGGILEAATNYVMGEDQTTPESTSHQVNGLAASLNQTRDAMNLRGEKLDTLGEKSAQLVETSSEFAKMANELRKQSEAGLFW